MVENFETGPEDTRLEVMVDGVKGVILNPPIDGIEDEPVYLVYLDGGGAPDYIKKSDITFPEKNTE